ncbi:MAG TPA: hypothetical protein PK233_08470 [Candidatus Atribacteria bacterium]|nr:hypothetical protein [Candidatus Atribacteria bacterium]
MADCPYLSGCPVFAMFKQEGLKNIWIRRYCQGEKQEECARLKMRNQGEKPPENLLPNGEFLRK